MTLLRVNKCRPFLRRDWNDGCTLYVPDSGETHLLPPAGSRLLDLLDAAPQPRDALLLQLDHGPSHEQMIDELIEAELIEVIDQ